jgi:hypothetical protein
MPATTSSMSEMPVTTTVKAIVHVSAFATRVRWAKYLDGSYQLLGIVDLESQNE